MVTSFEIPERTEFTDQAYSALGRGLAVATEYEGNCRALAGLLGVRSDPSLLKDERRLKEFSAKIWRRALKLNIDGIAKFIPTEASVGSILHEAREARNYLAHESAVGLKHILENEEERDRWFSELSERLRKIAEANLVVSGLTQLLSKEPLPIQDVLAKYPQKVVDWVCEK